MFQAHHYKNATEAGLIDAMDLDADSDDDDQEHFNLPGVRKGKLHPFFCLKNKKTNIMLQFLF